MNAADMRSRRIEDEARHDEHPRGSNAEGDVEHGRSLPRARRGERTRRSATRVDVADTLRARRRNGCCPLVARGSTAKLKLPTGAPLIAQPGHRLVPTRESFADRSWVTPQWLSIILDDELPDNSLTEPSEHTLPPRRIRRVDRELRDLRCDVEHARRDRRNGLGRLHQSLRRNLQERPARLPLRQLFRDHLGSIHDPRRILGILPRSARAPL